MTVGLALVNVLWSMRNVAPVLLPDVVTSPLLEFPPLVKMKPVTRVDVVAVDRIVRAAAEVMVVFPPPSRVIPTEPVMVTFDHDAVQGPGVLTVSPLEAEFIAACTSVCEHVAAVMVLAREGRQQNKAKPIMISTLIEDHLGNSQRTGVTASASFGRDNPEYLSIGARSSGIARKCWSRFLTVPVVACSDLCPQIEPAPRTFILGLPPDAHAI